jgi:hypothetical protein
MEKNFDHSFEEHLCIPFWTSFEVISGRNFIILGNFLGTRLPVTTLKSNFGKGLIFPALTNNFFEKTTTLGNFFSEIIFGVVLAALEQLSILILRNNFGE